MVNYYNFIEDNPGIQKGVEYHGDYFTYICVENIISVLPWRDQNGRRVMIYRMGNTIHILTDSFANQPINQERHTFLAIPK